MEMAQGSPLPRHPGHEITPKRKGNCRHQTNPTHKVAHGRSLSCSSIHVGGGNPYSASGKIHGDPAKGEAGCAATPAHTRKHQRRHQYTHRNARNAREHSEEDATTARTTTPNGTSHQRTARQAGLVEPVERKRRDARTHGKRKQKKIERRKERGRREKVGSATSRAGTCGRQSSRQRAAQAIRVC